MMNADSYNYGAVVPRGGSRRGSLGGGGHSDFGSIC